MEFTPKEERRRVFRNELYNLKELGYVSAEEYKNITEAHNTYFLDLVAKEEQENLIARKKLNYSQEITNKAEPVTNSGDSQNSPIKKLDRLPKPDPIKVKPKKSPEEIRERNISWSLNIGVIMLLIGGLYVATSNWETMIPWMKAGSIALVSALFYGIAYMSYRVLKIEKTAFAFVVLGSLFLPIFTLSLGWFQLLGSYLSFYGEGRFILGLVSSSVLIPIYTILAQKLSSRLFVWFTFISFSVSAAYLLRAMGLESDGFYLGLVIFNTVLIAVYHLLKKKGQHPLFTKELAVYTQANLVLSTLLMIFFYDNHVFNGFNLILTAIVYLSMIFVNGRNQYHFVFSTMIVYGAYQVLENWRFEGVSEIGYALLGFVFLFVTRLFGEQYALKKAFQITSAVVSGLAFVFITAEGLMLRSQNPSFILMTAYVIIALNFIYLANTYKNYIFRYLSPIFLASAMFEGVLQLDYIIEFENITLPLYLIGFVLFMIAGWQLKLKQMEVIKTSSRDVGMLIMLFITLITFSLSQWWELGVMFSLTSIVFYIVMKIDDRLVMPLLAQWAAPISIGLAAAAFGEEVRLQSSVYNDFSGMPGSFVIAGMLLIVASSIFKKIKDFIFSNSAFFSAHGFYAAGLFLTFVEPVKNMYGESFIWFGGILMSLLLYRKVQEYMVAILSGVVTLVFYLITVNSINEEILNFSDIAESLLMSAGGWTLLGVAALLFSREERLAGGFAWVGHVYLVPILAVSFILYGEYAIWAYLIATLVYVATISFVKKEWQIKSLLYGAFTTMFLAIYTGIMIFTVGILGHYAFLAASILIAGFWFLASTAYKIRTQYYLVPFSLLGIASFLVAYPYTWILYGITFGYAALLVVLLLRIKWDLIAIVPLMMLYYGTIQIINQARLEVMYDISILAGFGIALILTGKWIYQNLWEVRGTYGIRSLDAFSFVGFLFIISIAPLNNETFWALIIHGLLLSGCLWLQKNRVHDIGSTMIRFFAGAYLLVPYYAGIEQVNLPVLLEREGYVLPFVVLVIFLRYTFKSRYGRISSYIQWVVLIIVSLALIQDGLASNTVYDALILGSLSLISMLAGMWLRVKAYFFVGAGVLLLNVFMQTRPFWGNLPWWGYLLVAGSVLISVASFNEWNKQKGAKGEKTLVVRFKENMLMKLKDWK